MLKYGFFNSVNGDRKYDADDISNWLQHLVSDGVFADPANQMQVTAGGGMVVNVAPGWGFMKCKWVHNDAAYPLTLQSSAMLPRKDRIVLRLDTSNPARSISLAVKTGGYGENPTPPELTRSGNIYELSLATIYVDGNASAITQEDITDDRPDGDLCGFVAGLIEQIDAGALFVQYDAQFQAWFESVKNAVKATSIVVQFTEEHEVSSASQVLFTVDCEYYNPDLDILNVYVNGVLKYPGTDYTQSGTRIAFTDFLNVDDIVFFEILKSVDTEEAETVATFVRYFSTQINAINERLGGLSFRKMSKAAYDALTFKDPNTIYFVDTGTGIDMYCGDVPVSGGGGGGGGTPAPVQLAWSMPAVRSTRMTQMQFSPSGAWSCDPEWYYDGTQTARIAGQGYTKTNAKPAIGFVSQVNAGGYYSTLMLISDDPDAVSNGVATAANTSVQYGGVTWYATAYGYAQGGQWGDSTGHFQTYPDTLAYDSATGTLSAQAIADVLEYVHAAKNEEEER